MSYTIINFKTKKALKGKVEAFNKKEGQPIRCLGPDLSNYTGTVYLEGPHYPKAHAWYATAKFVTNI